jgi:hypothetical protein
LESSTTLAVTNRFFGRSSDRMNLSNYGICPQNIEE